MPVALGLLAWLVATVLYPFLRTEGRIAHRQILRRRVRTTLTIGILYIAVSTAISLGTNILDTVDDIHTWMEKTLKGDFVVRLMNQDVGSGQAAKMPEALVNDIRGIEGINNVDSVCSIQTTVHSRLVEGATQGVAVIVRDFTDKGLLPLDLQARATRGRSVSTWPKAKSCSATSWRTRSVPRSAKTSRWTPRKAPSRFASPPPPPPISSAATWSTWKAQTARGLLEVEGVDYFIVNAAPGSGPTPRPNSAHSAMSAG